MCKWETTLTTITSVGFLYVKWMCLGCQNHVTLVSTCTWNLLLTFVVTCTRKHARSYTETLMGCTVVTLGGGGTGGNIQHTQCIFLGWYGWGGGVKVNHVSSSQATLRAEIILSWHTHNV